MIEPLSVLAEDGDLPRWDVPAELLRLYGGAIGFEEPCVVANFVESLDGVVAVPGLPRSHAVIADESEADRFLMALLRACSDAIVLGSGTLLSSPRGTWRVDRPYPPAAAGLAELRALRDRPEQPLVCLVTTGASLDPSHPVLETGALVLTTTAAATRLRASVPAASEVVAVGDGDVVDLAAAVAELRRRGCSVVLSEGGPALSGGLVASRLVDELFLTVSPLVAGARSRDPARVRRGRRAAARDAGRGEAPLRPLARLAPLPALLPELRSALSPMITRGGPSMLQGEERSTMSLIDVGRRYDLTHLVQELRIAARTIRSQTLVERRERCDELVGALRDRLEPHAAADVQGLEALGVWTDSLESADANDADLLQELLYGLDALVRVHLWRETGMPLEPPEPRSGSDV